MHTLSASVVLHVLFSLTCEYLGLKYMTQPLLKALEIQVQSRQGKYRKGAHLLCMNIIIKIRASSLVCLSLSISSAMNFGSTTTGNSLLADVPHNKRCVFYHSCAGIPKQAMAYSTMCDCCW